MNDEIKEAIKDLDEKRALYNMADMDFEDVAYHELLAAKMRLNALLKEQLKEFKNEHIGGVRL